MSFETVHVAVGIVFNPSHQVLISKRAMHVHQGGLWEFPGGKVESAEDARSALSRELHEELGITIESSVPLMKIDHDYGDKRVCLHILEVSRFNGDAFGKEGQFVKWVDVNDLHTYDFPEANISIINRLQLPDFIQITGKYHDIDDLIKKTKFCISKNIKMLHFRAHELNDSEYILHANVVADICQENNIKFILNRSPEAFDQIDADGLHMSRHEMKKYLCRPIAGNKLLSVSCHGNDELQLAKKLNVDYCFLSPVKTAISHVVGKELGFDRFSVLSQNYDFPVYALGGMTQGDLSRIITLGGQGVAAISEFWE